MLHILLTLDPRLKQVRKEAKKTKDTPCVYTAQSLQDLDPVQKFNESPTI